MVCQFRKKLSEYDKKISSRIVKEIIDRLSFLNNVGLNYLQLSRSSTTLSGGESQRIRLASQIGSGLTGVSMFLTNHLLVFTKKTIRNLL